MGSDERERANSLLSRIAAGATFLTDAAGAFKGSSLAKWISGSSEIANAALDSAAEAVPIVKFVTAFLDRVTHDKPTLEDLAFVACSTAYQQSLYDAIKAVGVPSHDNFTDQVRIGLRVFASKDEIDFATLDYDELLSHEFIRTADDATETYAKHAGYDDTQRTRLMGVLHRTFGRKLRLLVGDPGLRAKFEPLAAFLQMKDAGVAAHSYLERHATYQRALFETQPVLRIEPYALSDIYVDTECGVLRWGELQKGLRERARGDSFDPFLDAHGGRRPLLETVLAFLEEPAFDDAIVIQGVAGAGKSAFTLRLAIALLDRGLLPIRVRLRDIDMDRPIGEALAGAVPVSDVKSFAPPRAVRESFASGTLFEETVPYGKTRICPYVLILDGWDEISISADEGFRQRVDRMLHKIRSEYLTSGKGRVRVILTGRPSQDVDETGFFLDGTPILTIRHLRPTSVRSLFDRVRNSLENPPLRGHQVWTLPSPEALKPVLDAYDKSYAAGRREADSVMDVLGLPLLAHIALRLFGLWKGNLAALIGSPSALYRSLVDITCDKGGRPITDDLDAARKALLRPDELRMLLRDTAVAITTYGADNIPSAELEKRLRRSFVHLEAGANAAARYPFSSLMINFFFKGGYRELGCEFLHKSFREYLFAEGVVEILKRYAVDHPELQQERTRDLYWKDFEELDPRYQLTTDLMEALTAQWITPEVDRHIDALIDWEIARAAGNEEPSPGTATERLSLAQWELIRDTLADLWDWWGEGVHLRPQPRMVNDKQTFARSRIDELVAWSAPPPKRGALHSRPPRTATLDAHLGDALFRLNAITHARIAFSTGWSAFKRTALEMWAGVQVRGHVCRRYQTRIVERHRAWVFFAPSGPDPLYFQFYSSRIDGAGYRPGGPFPLGAMCWVLDLRSVYLRIPDHTYSRQVASWRYSNLSGADAAGSAFVGHELISVLARVANFTRCTFDSAVLDWSDFAGARLSSCTFRDASVHELNLRDASIEKSQLLNARRTDNVVLDP